MTRRIVGFKIIRKGKKQGVLVTHEHQYVDHSGAIVPVTTPSQFHQVIPHQDLIALWDRLSIHYAAITEREEHDDSTIANEGEIERCATEYPVSSIQWKDGKNYTGIMFHGHKVLSTGASCNALTRLVKFNDETEPYELADQLQELSDAIRAEVEALLNGKHAKPAQTNLTDPDQAIPEEEEQEA